MGGPVSGTRHSPSVSEQGLQSLARGIFRRLHEDGRFADEAALNEIQKCTNTMLNHGGPSAYQVAFGSNSADVSSWEDGDRGRDFLRNVIMEIAHFGPGSEAGRNAAQQTATRIRSQPDV